MCDSTLFGGLGGRVGGRSEERGLCRGKGQRGEQKKAEEQDIGRIRREHWGRRGVGVWVQVVM